MGRGGHSGAPNPEKKGRGPDRGGMGPEGRARIFFLRSPRGPGAGGGGGRRPKMLKPIFFHPEGATTKIIGGWITKI